MELTPIHLRQLQALVAAGFEPVRFPLFPGHVGVKKHGCAALLRALPEGGFQAAAQPGYLIEGNISAVVEQGGERWFVWKSQRVRATEKLLGDLRRFEEELQRLLEESRAV